METYKDFIKMNPVSGHATPMAQICNE